MSVLKELHSWRIAVAGQNAFAVATDDNGHLAAVGAESGLHIFNGVGERYLQYPSQERSAWPVRFVSVNGDMTSVILGTQAGNVLHLGTQRDGGRIQLRSNPLQLSGIPADISSLALSATSDLVAVGHRSRALTMLHLDGQIVWARHPNLGNPTRGSQWRVAFDASGDRLYAASGGNGTNALFALDTSSGSATAAAEVRGRVTRIAALEGPPGVITVTNEGQGGYRLAAYDAELAELRWEQLFHAPITALDTDPPAPFLVIASGYEGTLSVLDACTGEVLRAAAPRNVWINDVAVAASGRIAAVTEDGVLYYFRYAAGLDL